jgi:hypothetical protein
VQREKVKLIKIKGCFFNKRRRGSESEMRKKRERERKERGIMTKMKERFCRRITKYVNLLFNSLIKAV